MKRVPRRSRLAFGCHRHKLAQIEERGRERERETIRKVPKTIQIYQDILKRKNVCMGMHENVTCNIKSIIGLTQSNPTSTQSVAHIYMHDNTVIMLM